MKSAKFLLPAILLLFFVHNAFADEQSHRQLAEEFIVLTEVEQLMDKSFSKAKATQLRRIDVEYQDVDPVDVEALKEKVGEYLDGQLRFERVRGDFARVYMEFFNEEELVSIVEFYKSPAIKKLKENDRDLKLKLMKATQDQMTDLNYQIKNMKDAFAVEQEEKKQTPGVGVKEEQEKTQ